MILRPVRVVMLLMCLLLSACGTLFPTPAVTGPAAVTETPSTPAAGTATSSTPELPRVLRVWLPAQFDPNADSPASRTLKSRLDVFARDHSEIVLDIRIKEQVEPGSLLKMLSLAGVAAPETLPDLVALPRPDMEDAALKGAIHPIEGLTQILDDSRWYSYARQLGHVQNSAYGLPFAGDALVLAYDPDRFSVGPPETWDVILRRPGALALKGDDPQVLFMISLYRSMNGGLLDAQNHPMLEEFALEPVLSFLEQSRINSSIMVESESAAWQELRSGRAAWTVTTVTRALSETGGGFDLAPLPGLAGEPFTLATSWSWVLAGSNPENESLAIELAEWLIEDDFLTVWVSESGFLSTRSSDINERFPSLSVAAESAQPVPSNDLLIALTPVLQEAAGRILGGESVETVTGDTVEAMK
jgi:multiple sugar transport system substrate-binding protein